MTSEEQEAIKGLKHAAKNPESKFWLGTQGMENIKIVLNLIDRQQKELEERNKYNITTLPFEKIKADIEQNKNISIFGKEYISEDKIREKIKELENKNEENKIALAKGIDTLNFNTIENARNNIAINVNVRDILRNLLEEN